MPAPCARRALPILLPFAAALAACDVTELRPGATSIFQVFAPPTPQEAAALAIDKYDPDKRYRGTLLLGNAPFAGEPLYLALFRDNAKDEDPGVRMAATRALGNHGAPDDVPLLVERLKDTDPAVRQEAARALQRVHNPAAIDPLIAATKEKNEPLPEVRAEAAGALGQYAERRVVAELINALTDTQLAVNRTTLGSLRTLTGQDFGLDVRGWQNWFSKTPDPFAARAAYIYPVYSRSKFWYEYIPFVPPPPNETPSTPAGLPSGPG